MHARAMDNQPVKQADAGNHGLHWGGALNPSEELLDGGAADDVICSQKRAVVSCFVDDGRPAGLLHRGKAHGERNDGLVVGRPLVHPSNDLTLKKKTLGVGDQVGERSPP